MRDDASVRWSIARWSIEEVMVYWEPFSRTSHASSEAYIVIQQICDDYTCNSNKTSFAAIFKFTPSLFLPVELARHGYEDFLQAACHFISLQTLLILY